MIKIMELRDRTKTALGAKFDLRAFHHVLIENGAVPIEILEQLVNDWIAAGQRS